MQARDKCIFCHKKNLEEILPDGEFQIPQSMCLMDTNNHEQHWMSYNIQKCLNCNTYQNKYLADINILYGQSHIAPYGTIRKNMTTQCSDFILKNIINTNKNQVILEIGGGDGQLSDCILENNSYITKYIIVDPSYVGNTSNRTIYNTYIENLGELEKDILSETNIIIMSHVFELEVVYSPGRAGSAVQPC